MLLALLPGAMSCSTSGTGELATIPEISFKNPVAMAGGSQFISVSASASWTLTITFNGEQKDWAWFSNGAAKSYSFSGEGSVGNIPLTCSANESEFTRKAILTVRSGSKMQNYTLTQNGPQPDSPVDGSDASNDPEPVSGDPSTEPAPTATGWLELPATDLGDGYAMFTHYMTVTGVRKRNYSYYWNKGEHISIWVAYPMNTSLIGKGSRPDPEPWAMDPLLKAAGYVQADVTGTFNPSSTYGRGHQIASADRYVGDGNAQTYYSSNMTPQRHDFNGNIWASLEGRVRNWAKSAGTDTLYVVTGCEIKNSKSRVTSNGNGVMVPVPTAYYKAVLRHTKTVSVGYNGYSGLAIWLEHRDYGEGSTTGKSDFISIDALEQKLGIDLFASLPSVVGEEVAAKIEAEDPKNPADPNVAKVWAL